MTIVTAASAHEVPKEVLDGFWKLSDAKENVRIEAGTKIIEHAKVKYICLSNRNGSEFATSYHFAFHLRPHTRLPPSPTASDASSAAYPPTAALLGTVSTLPSSLSWANCPRIPPRRTSSPRSRVSCRKTPPSRPRARYVFREVAKRVWVLLINVVIPIAGGRIPLRPDALWRRSTAVGQDGVGADG